MKGKGKDRKENSALVWRYEADRLQCVDVWIFTCVSLAGHNQPVLDIINRQLVRFGLYKSNFPRVYLEFYPEFFFGAQPG
jgi:hypothetical protein